MPAEQEIVHWYNQIPDIANVDIPDDYPATPNDYPSNYMTELTDLLNRLCDSEGNITWEISDGFVNIISSNPSRGTYSFRLSQWRDNEREVKRYLREWFPSFNIPYTMGGLANYIHNPEPVQTRILDEVRRHYDNIQMYNSAVFGRIDIPNSVTRVIESKDTPATCTGKEEVPYTKYKSVI